MEISQDSIKNSPVDTKTKLTNDLMRLLQVRDKNEAMSKDWLLFLISSKFSGLRPGEIYEAFRMAMGRELLDADNREFDIYPELSNNTTGKVLNTYLIWKNENSVYQLAKSNLKQLGQVTEMSDDQKRKVREEFLNMVYDEMATEGFSDSAWLLYDDIKPRLTVSDEVLKRLYSIQKYKNRYVRKSVFKIAAGGYNLKNTCRSIVACNYLKKHMATLEGFKSSLENG